MSWLRRRRRTEPDAAPVDAAHQTDPGAAGTDDRPGPALVPLVPAVALERTERALKMLAAQSAQLHSQIVHLEHRVDSLSDALVDRLDVPTHDDVLEARMHSARVGAELSRLEVNLAARLDAVRAELRAAQGAPDAEVDLRDLTPHDTGWAAVG
jgi:hypothetical protein